MRQFVRGTGTGNSVHLIGPVEDASAWIRRAELVWVPSLREGGRYAALEAMACEVVPVATRVGGVPEVIEHGKSGYLADVGDVETMARYAIELLSDDSRLQEMAKASRAVAAAEATVPMRAIKGRASFLGERSIGHMDPGARSSSLMIAAVCAAMEG